MKRTNVRGGMYQGLIGWVCDLWKYDLWLLAVSAIGRLLCGHRNQRARMKASLTSPMYGEVKMITYLKLL